MFWNLERVCLKFVRGRCVIGQLFTPYIHIKFICVMLQVYPRGSVVTMHWHIGLEIEE